jgi:hypothetical protein
MRKLFFIIILLSFFSKVFSQSLSDKMLNIQRSNDVENSFRTSQNNASAVSKKDSIKKSNKTNIIQIGAGGVLTSLNFFKNAQQFTYYPAYSGRLYYQPSQYIRFVIDYTKVKNVNLIPTWLNVQNTYIDIDAHILMHFNDKISSAYFILGASSQFWKSFYTGIDDYNNHATRIPNTNYNTVYYGAIIGIGVEFRILPRFHAYGEIRYKITNTDVGFGLSDVCYGVGMKYTLVDIHPGHVYKRPGKHFHWF